MQFTTQELGTLLMLCKSSIHESRKTSFHVLSHERSRDIQSCNLYFHYYIKFFKKSHNVVYIAKDADKMLLEYVTSDNLLFGIEPT